MIYSLPQLEYSYDALEPAIDARTMEIHHSKHHQGYINKLNAALENHPVFSAMPIDQLLQSLAKLPRELRTVVQDNGGGHANHSLFWSVMGPQCGSQPQGKLAQAINTTFGSFIKFQQQFQETGMSRFGSGWVWLTLNTDHQLAIESTPNQDSPLSYGHRPILGLDLWEHAYYLNYQYRRADYIDAWWKVISWRNVARWYWGDKSFCGTSADTSSFT